MKVILYERSSTTSSFAEDAMRGRQAMLADYAEKAGIEIVETCVDVGYLGSTMERPDCKLPCAAYGRDKLTRSCSMTGIGSTRVCS